MPKEKLDKLRSSDDLVVLEELDLHLRYERYWWISIIVIPLIMILASFNIVSLTEAAILGVITVLLLKSISIQEAYESINWPVIILLGSMIPLGNALQLTGGTELIAHGISDLASSVPTFVIIAMLLVVTMTLSDLMNNAATAIVMAPIGSAIAQQLEVSVDPFLMAIAIGASCAFLTPIGHQNNVLVMGPGGYKFGDYWRMGLPLEILIVIVSVPLILMVWPL